MTPSIEIAVDCEDWSAVADLPALVERTVGAASAAAAPDLPSGSELSILFCGDTAIRVLNRDWRGLDKPTNVLSFPAAAPDRAGVPRLLGDIAVAFETTRREAREEMKTFEAHLTHLLVHGFLHVIGHDHETPVEARLMEALETTILAALGIADPYAADEPAETAVR